MALSLTRVSQRFAQVSSLLLLVFVRLYLVTYSQQNQKIIIKGYDHVLEANLQMIQSYLNFKRQVVDSSYYKSTYGYIPITVQISVGNSVSKKYVLQISYYATQSIRPAESTEVKERRKETVQLS